MLSSLFSLVASSLMILHTPVPPQDVSVPAPLVSPSPIPSPIPVPRVIFAQDYSLVDRHENQSVNNVFADNILLTLAYMNGMVKNGKDIPWDKVRAPGEFTLVLKPGQTFAFHDSILDEYKNTVAATTNAHFNANEGFKSDGFLFGDGVCHLASFMNVAAKSAGLKVEAPVNHNFAEIPEVSKTDGVSIYYSPNDSNMSAQENLYITNVLDKAVTFVFSYNLEKLSITVQTGS